MIETTNSGLQAADSRSTFKPNPEGTCRLDELLALDDGEFIRGAYLILLRRAPDDAGFAHYLGLLRNGEAKIDILELLRSSEEGRAHVDAVDGLAAAARRRKIFRVPLLGGLARIVAGISNLPDLERKQHALENNASRTAADLQASAREFERVWLELRGCSDGLRKQAEDLRRLAGAIEARPERRELSSLTNNLVALTNSRLTKPDIAPIEQSVEELKLALAEIDRTKADITALQVAQAEARAGLQAALEAVRQLVVPLAKSAAASRPPDER